MKSRYFCPVVAISLLSGVPTFDLAAQTPAGVTQSAAPRQSGTVKAVTLQDFVLTSAAGQDVAVTLTPTTRVLLVDPQTHNVKAARPGTSADIAAGDKAVVTGTAGDAGQSMTAVRVLLLKSGAIAAMHASEQAAWAHSVGGVVRSATDGTLVIGNAGKTYTVTTTPATIVRRYSGTSVNFADAVKSSVAQIQPGDQVQARGTRSADGNTMAANEIVAGSFSNYSGAVTAVDPTTGSLTLKDLATKAMVTVHVTSQTALHALPPGFGMGMGARTAATRAPAEGAAATSGARAAGARAGMDLSRVVNRLPVETLADIKPGTSVILVASRGDGGEPTAITVVSGAEQLLSSSGGREATISPWSLGGAEAEGGGEGGGSGSGGR